MFCTSFFILFFSAIVSFFLIQISRELENVTCLAYLTCSLMVLMTIMIVIEVTTTNSDLPSRSTGSTTNTTTTNTTTTTTTITSGGDNWELFVGQGQHPLRYHWANVLSAIGTFVYSCLPACIVVETMAALAPKDQLQMERVVDGSFLAYATVYLLSGLPAVLRWGGDLPEPVTLVFANSFPGVIVKLVLIAGTLLDFVLASTTVNRFIMRWLKPDFNYKWTKSNAWIWAQCSLPSSAMAVGMALFIPRLQSLTGILNSIAGATLQITAVPLALALTKNSDVDDMTGVTSGVEVVQRRWYQAAACYGGLFTILVFLAACYDISTTRYQVEGNETFWCDVVGG